MLHVTSPPFYKKIENGSMIQQKYSKSKSPCGYNKSKCKLSWYQKAQLQFTKPKKTTDIRQVFFRTDEIFGSGNCPKESNCKSSRDHSTDWLTGILIMVYHYNPCIIG